jgi:hypothetical protein
MLERGDAKHHERIQCRSAQTSLHLHGLQWVPIPDTVKQGNPFQVLKNNVVISLSNLPGNFELPGKPLSSIPKIRRWENGG